MNMFCVAKIYFLDRKLLKYRHGCWLMKVCWILGILEYLVYVVDSVGVSSVGITNHTFAHGAEATKDALMIDEKRVVRHLSDGMVQSFFNTVIGFEDALICWKFVWVSTKAEEVFNQIELGCKRSSTPCFKREELYVEDKRKNGFTQESVVLLSGDKESTVGRFVKDALRFVFWCQVSLSQVIQLSEGFTSLLGVSTELRCGKVWLGEQA